MGYCVGLLVLWIQIVQAEIIAISPSSHGAKSISCPNGYVIVGVISSGCGTSAFGLPSGFLVSSDGQSSTCSNDGSMGMNNVYFCAKKCTEGNFINYDYSPSICSAGFFKTGVDFMYGGKITRVCAKVKNVVVIDASLKKNVSCPVGHAIVSLSTTCGFMEKTYFDSIKNPRTASCPSSTFLNGAKLYCADLNL